MKRAKITSMIDFIRIVEPSANRHGEFYMRDKIQYIDIDHLEVYTVKELSIINGRPIAGAKKDHYIKLIRGNVAFMTKQRAINRSLTLDLIGI